MMKWIIGLVVIVAAAAALWWSGWLGDFSMKSAENQQATTTPQQATSQTPTDLPTAANDTSDSAITQDTASVDAQIKTLSSDSTSVDQSLNDKAGAQEF